MSILQKQETQLVSQARWSDSKLRLECVLLFPLLQVREDVTRYRYGDEQHLDEALGRIFMFGRVQGIARRCDLQSRDKTIMMAA